MNNVVYYSPEFKKSLKPLAKKYKTLKESIFSLQSALTENPYLGESYGDGIYKVRWGDPSKGKGKSGGFRIMYYMLSETDSGIEMILLTIFDKSEADTIKKQAAINLKDDVLSSMGLKDPKKDR